MILDEYTTSNLTPEIEIEDNSGDESEEAPFRYSLTSYGADYDVHGLVRRISKGDIYIPTFQRSYVWDLRKASRFIESLLLGLPVPGIFLATEPGRQKQLVIDGQQRLKTLQYFYDGKFKDGKVFVLRGVDPELEGKTYQALSANQQLGLDNTIIHATVIKQENSEGINDSEGIFFIFERLNTGGTQLQPQEIRAAVYHSKLNQFLKELNQNKQWRKIYGAISPRAKDQELILRFFALYFDGDKYHRPMKQFLNNYMSKNRSFSSQSEVQLIQTFTSVITTVYECIGEKAFKPSRALNAAVFDSVMVGLAKRLENGKNVDCALLRKAYDSLLNNVDYPKAITQGTANEELVARRIVLATKAFAEV